MTAFVDTNILVRHLTGDPQAMAKRATAFLATQPELYLADLIVAETVYVLESFYKAPREQVATAMQAGFSQYWTKPLDVQQTLNSLHEILQADVH